MMETAGVAKSIFLDHLKCMQFSFEGDGLMETPYLACLKLNNIQSYVCFQTSQWWLMRCLCIQQQILDDKSNTLRETVKELIENSE